MTELMKRATIEEIEGYRHRALDLFGTAFDTLREAERLMRLAAPTSRGSIYDDGTRDSLAPTYGNADRDKFLSRQRRRVDTAIWHHLLQSTNFDKLMDRRAREQFNEQLEKDPPEATAANCFETMSGLFQDRDLIFKRGVAEAFSRLDRRFRTHDAFAIGSKIILDGAFSGGNWNYYRKKDEDFRDVERAFHLLDGRPAPDGYAGIVGVINEERARHRYGDPAAFTVENEYFRVRIFKNGNLHAWLLRADLVEKINKLLADYYGATLADGSEEAREAATNNPFKRSTAVARNFGFFETPDDVGAIVVEKAGLSWGGPHTVLEPSAGGGRLARLALGKDPNARITCVEVQSGLASSLEASGLFERVVNDDFLQLRPGQIGTFSRIVMNPPFDKGLDIDHVVHAFNFLAPGGVLVAVMSASVEFRSDRKYAAFRDLVDANRGDFTDLPAGSFKESGTMVNTLIATLRK